MRFPHKCRDCGRRCVLNRRAEDYEVRRRCPHCGSFRLWFDRWQYEYRRKRKTCDCGGLPHPHRPASSAWCLKHPTGPGEKDQIKRYGGYNLAL